MRKTRPNDPDNGLWIVFAVILGLIVASLVTGGLIGPILMVIP